jgi:hypothetical protein
VVSDGVELRMRSTEDAAPLAQPATAVASASASTSRRALITDAILVSARPRAQLAWRHGGSD